MNQCLLDCIGVSHRKLAKVCTICERYGLSAKLTGAGGGGCAFALIPSGMWHAFHQFWSVFTSHSIRILPFRLLVCRAWELHQRSWRVWLRRLGDQHRLRRNYGSRKWRTLWQNRTTEVFTMKQLKLVSLCFIRDVNKLCISRFLDCGFTIRVLQWRNSNVRCFV